MIKKKKAFTLIELLAVIVVLAVILAIALPGISNLTSGLKKNAFESDVKMIVKTIENRKIVDDDFDVTELSIDNLKNKLKISDQNYQSIRVKMIDDDIYIDVVGKNKWDGLRAYGIKDKLVAVDFDNKITPTDESCFAFNASTKTITDYYHTNPSCSSNVVIPSQIGGVTVETLGDYSFERKGLVSVIIPSGVSSICAQAFARNLLTIVDIPDTVTYIASYAFEENQLTNVEIPSGITVLDKGVFSGNQLTNITLHNGITSIEDWAFSGNQLRSVDVPSSVTHIGENAFESNQLTNLKLRNGILSIGDGAFYDNLLGSVDIPSSVTYIGFSAFGLNQLTSLTISSNAATIRDGAFMENQITTITMAKPGIILGEYLLTINNSFRTSYVAGGAGTYKGTQNGTSWIKQ